MTRDLPYCGECGFSHTGPCDLLTQLRDLLRDLHDGGVIPPGEQMERAGQLLNHLEEATGDVTSPDAYVGSQR